MMRTLWTLLGTALLIAPAVRARANRPDAAPLLFARPVEEVSAVLHNPDMSWLLYAGGSSV